MTSKDGKAVLSWIWNHSDPDMQDVILETMRFAVAIQHKDPELQAWALETVTLLIEADGLTELEIWRQAIEGWE